MISQQTIGQVGKVLDAWLPGKIFYDRTPGIAVGIVHKGKLVYAKGFGYADLDSQTPTTSRTNFRIASISKTFTAVAILQLVEKGVLKLSDPVGKHLAWTEGDVARLTVRQVLSHNGGILRDGDTSHWTDDKFPDSEELQKSFLRTKPVRGYTNRFKYSNFGFALLGEIIRQKSGLSYNEYVTRNIINRLELKNTFPDFAPDSVDELASGYSRDIPGEKRTAFVPAPTNAYAPAAGFISNIEDLAKYANALGKGTLLLSKKSKQELSRGITGTGRSDGKYGLGFGVINIQGNTIVGHGGGFPGFITRFHIDQINELAVIVLTNTNASSAVEIEKGIFELIYRFPSLRHQGKRLSDTAQGCSGWYRSRWDDVSVTSGETCLYAFNPKAAPSPNNIITLIPKVNGFEIKSPDGFGHSGELAIFAEGTLRWGSIPYTKLL